INGQSSDGLPQVALSNSSRDPSKANERFEEAQNFLNSHPDDLMARIALATRLWNSGHADEASAVFREIGKQFDGATFSRTFEHKPVVTNLPGEIETTYALLIGISRYRFDPPVQSLKYADKDAELF